MAQASPFIDTEKLSDLPRVKVILSGRAGIQTLIQGQEKRLQVLPNNNEMKIMLALQCLPKFQVP